MTDNENKYWAFLSYSQQDNCAQRSDTPDAGRRCWGDWLQDALKTFSVPAEFIGQINGRGEVIPERIHPLFRDESALPGEAALSEDIRTALAQSICLVVICSPRSAKSLHVNEAVRHFKQLGRGKPILPVVIAGEPYASAGNLPASSPADECFVPALRHPLQPDGSLDLTRRAGKSIFVDARHGVEKREILADDHRHAEADLAMAKIQLIALLLGVGFNGLWWREQQRHFFELAEARHQAREALNQLEKTQRQLQAAQNQVREAQDKALELQNLPRDVHGQIQEAQNQAREAENQARDAQRQLQELQNKVRAVQTQLEQARDRALAAESKVLEAQNRAQNTQNQLEEARSQTQSAHDQFLAAQGQIQEHQDQARSAQAQLEAAQNEVRETQSKVLAPPPPARAARRLIKVLALIAVLASLAAVIAASMAWRQRRAASQALAKPATTAVWQADLAAGTLNPEQLQPALQNLAGAEQTENQQRSLDQLAAGIPQPEIPAGLAASAVILDDQQRSHFQKWLLVRLGWVNPASAMTNASAVTGKIVNDAGLPDSVSYFQLAVLDNWLKTDLPGALNWACHLPDTSAQPRALETIIATLADDHPQTTLARLNALQPAPDERIYQSLFQRWAAHDPLQAIQLWQQLPGQDHDDAILCAIITEWVDQQPEAALNWVKSQPDSEATRRALAAGLNELAKTDVPRALTQAESLSVSPWRSALISSIGAQADPAAAWTWLNRPDEPPTIMQPRTNPWPWTKLLLNPALGSLTTAPVETETSSGPVPIKPPE